MAWLKRNLVLVLGGAVAIVLLGAAGFYLFSGYRKNAAISGELTAAASEFTRLNNRTPSVTEENIEAAATDQKRVDAVRQEFQKYFAPFNARTNIESAEFKFLLATTIDELEDMAEGQGVRRPKDFAYTFDKQRSAVTFAPEDLLPWTEQLMEIKALTEIIYRARVHSLLQIRRASSSTNDTQNFVLRGVAPVTNSTAKAVTTAYEVIFQGFTSELSEFLDGIAKSPHCFLVKNVNVEKSSTPTTTSMGGGDPSGMAARYGMAPGAFQPATPSPQQAMNQRYGLGAGGGAANRMADRYGGAGGGMSRAMQERYGMNRGQTPQPAQTYGVAPLAPTRRGPETVLDESLLRFTIRLDAVRPLLAAK